MFNYAHRMIQRTLIAAILFCGCGSAIAQTAGGSISGTVRDAAEGVIPGAAIVVRNVETGAQQMVDANANGFYAFAALPVGHYEMEVNFSGFKPNKRTGLIIDVGTKLQIDVAM